MSIHQLQKFKIAVNKDRDDSLNNYYMFVDEIDAAVTG
jgi:hypothetical protein